MQNQGKGHNRRQAGLIRPYIFIQRGIEVFMENEKGAKKVVGWLWLRIREKCDCDLASMDLYVGVRSMREREPIK